MNCRSPLPDRIHSGKSTRSARPPERLYRSASCTSVVVLPRPAGASITTLPLRARVTSESAGETISVVSRPEDQGGSCKAQGSMGPAIRDPLGRRKDERTHLGEVRFYF